METEDLIASDLILLLLVAPSRWPKAKNRINGITRLEKLLFLIDKECKHKSVIAEAFEFVPYHYGPYSREVYEAVELLEEADLLAEDRKLTESTLDCAEELLYADVSTELSHERQFLLTENGRHVAEFIAKNYPKLYKQIRQIKDRYAGLELRDLIYYVYTTYPDYTEQSVIRDEVIGAKL